jgi:hypothetical protein
MKFLFNKISAEEITEELQAVQEVLMSSAFVYFDLALFSVVLTTLLSPLLKTATTSVFFFLGSYMLQVGAFLVIKKWFPD